MSEESPKPRHRSFVLTPRPSRTDRSCDDEGNCLISVRVSPFAKYVGPTVSLILASLVYATLFSHADGVSSTGITFFYFAACLGTLVVTQLHKFGLADEVWDCGEYLRVKRGRVTEQIAFADVRNLSCVGDHAVIDLKKTGPLGREIAFSLPMSLSLYLSPIQRPRVYYELLDKIDQARESAR